MLPTVYVATVALVEGGIPLMLIDVTASSLLPKARICSGNSLN